MCIRDRLLINDPIVTTGLRARPIAWVRVKPDRDAARLLGSCECWYVTVGCDDELLSLSSFVGVCGNLVQLEPEQPKVGAVASPSSEQHSTSLDIEGGELAKSVRHLSGEHERGHHAASGTLFKSSRLISAMKLSRPSIPDCHWPGWK